MRHATAFALLLSLCGCASSPATECTPLRVHGEKIGAQEGTRFCYQLIFCPLVSAD
ncbi:hypothetical protein [Pseudomonas sp. Gutcm_11s]|uniref:hypothetical protein n=1 Tax=Pseudomonas sp. Gutcm_11s TaxID=3026088 RepID=UPI00235E6084|nr:hypothetical protein [Pseudomonas sp. Gutcm_11s]MDD0842442.1 hypothetical protein [Pseudomonas sp. Gutcm_11s]